MTLVQKQIQIRSKSSSLTQRQVLLINQFSAKATREISAYMQEQFNLLTLPENYAAVYDDYRVNKRVSADILTKVLIRVLTVQFGYSRQVALLLELSPEDVGKPREEFCLFYPRVPACRISDEER